MPLFTEPLAIASPPDDVSSQCCASSPEPPFSPSLAPSSAPSSPPPVAPDFSDRPSCFTTPLSSLSLAEFDSDDDDPCFPSYDEDPVPDAPTPEKINPCCLSEDSPARRKSQEEIPCDIRQPIRDDCNVQIEPCRHVDYLSHEWREEDIWASWRYVVRRRGFYANGPRLENAAWRTWAKAKHGLRSVSPSSLNWMKDHDVTWLYGPLQADSRQRPDNSTPPGSQLSRIDSSLGKKPILKKRSLSELMLQRSRSSATLMKQATDAIQAQSPRGRGRRRRSSSSDGFKTPLARITTYPGSSHLSGDNTPTHCRHIHFNNRVEQCIAIEKERISLWDLPPEETDDDSDDELLTMKPAAPPAPQESKIIAMLPDTTLKYRSETPEPESVAKPKEQWWRSVARNASQHASEAFLPKIVGSEPETPANNVYDEDDDYEDYNGDSVPLDPGLRRTRSGMFMPVDDGDASGEGLIDRVVDSVNTARDICHVIWHVGWHQ